MKNQIENASFIQEMIETTSNLYRLGWDERNGGNISYLLHEDELTPYLDLSKVNRNIPMDFDGTALIGQYFLVTGSGKFFKNVKKDPSVNLGIIRVADNGTSVDVLWGYSDGGLPTSELPSHLMNHIARLSVNPNHRVVMHCHATHLLAMTFTHDLDECAFTRTLWQMCTECLVVFPDGIGIVPWLVPGTNEIGIATSEKMKESRLVIWPHHGIYGSGETMDETFGLIETAEKSAQVYTIVCAQGPIKQTISDGQLKQLADRFDVIPREGYLKL